LTESSRQRLAKVLGFQNRACIDKAEKGGPSMGDKSPKSVRRQTTQKQAKSSAADQKKQQAIAAKRSVFKKG
jgi:hypothetical protein